MAQTTEKEKREERPAGFTDGAYIPRSEAPKMPRVFSNEDVTEPKAPERRGVPLSMTVLLCMLFLFLGLWLGRLREENILPPVQAPLPTESAPAGVPAAPFRETRGGESDAGNASGLGIAVQTVSAAAAEYYDLYWDNRVVEGVQIYAVEAGSAAQAAGLLPGDILMALDGESIRTEAELAAAESRCHPGEEVLCTLFREGETVEIPVVFAPGQREGTKTPG